DLRVRRSRRQRRVLRHLRRTEGLTGLPRFVAHERSRRSQGRAQAPLWSTVERPLRRRRQRQGEATLMARPLWSGSISFGLVNVPVKAYTAVRDHDVHFHQVDKKSGSRIRHRNVSESSGREVKEDDVEMGFEVSKGHYVTFDKDELRALRPASTKAIEVDEFVALEDIDPIYYERTYWLAPDGEPGQRADALLLTARGDPGAG